MRRTLLAVSCLVLVLVVVLIAGAGLGIAQPSQPVEDARPTPTPILPLPEKEPVSPQSPEIPPLPDLIVDKIEVVPATPFVGQVVTIKVTIKNPNAYDVTPGNNFYSDLYVDPAVVPIQLGQDGVHFWGCQATWVPAGGSRVLETPYIFDRVRSYSLWAQVDTDNHVQESNEYNNVSGPVIVQVLAADQIVQQTHRTFQLGMASSLDISHPEGVIRPGIFVEPSDEAAIEA
ncbi:MAG: CARDB domain-containing protein, partial [Anaerolineae bacterium]